MLFNIEKRKKYFYAIPVLHPKGMKKTWVGSDFDLELIVPLFIFAVSAGLFLSVFIIVKNIFWPSKKINSKSRRSLALDYTSMVATDWLDNYRGDYPECDDKKRYKKPIKFFTENEKKQIIRSIEKFENQTSCELRIHIAEGLGLNPIIYAKQIFSKLKINKTKRENGCLLCVGLRDAKVKIFGDKSIRWENQRSRLDEIEKNIQLMFETKNYVKILCKEIQALSNVLSDVFPWEDNKNELSDDLSFEK